MTDIWKDVNFDGEIFQFLFGIEDANFGSGIQISIDTMPGLMDFAKGPVTEVADDLPDVLGIDIGLDVRKHCLLFLFGVQPRAAEVQHFFQIAKKRHLG